MLHHNTILFLELENEIRCLTEEVKQDGLAALSGFKSLSNASWKGKYLWAAFYQKVVITVLVAIM